MERSTELIAEHGVGLSTGRLVLRWPEQSDLPNMIAMWGDADVVRYIGGRPFEAEEVWHRLLHYRGHWALLGYGYWIIRESATGAFVGEVGFADWHRNELSELEGRPEGGWVLTPAMQGKGYAAEALTAALAWLDRSIDVSSSACIIAPDNARSLRLAEHRGYRIARLAAYRGSETYVLVRDRDTNGGGTVRLG